MIDSFPQDHFCLFILLFVVVVAYKVEEAEVNRLKICKWVHLFFFACYCRDLNQFLQELNWD